MFAVLAVVLLAAHSVCAVPMPQQIVLSAPFTPFHDDASRSLNVDPVPALAANTVALGANTVWVCGSMGQFDSMTVAERKTLAEAWVKAGHDNGLYMIIHVGTTVIQDAVELAEHAQSIGADAIASVPPYYQKPSTIQDLVDFLKPITEAAPKLPFWYYHIPGMTGVTFAMYDFFNIAGPQLPTLTGVKFVSTDQFDWMQCIESHAPSYNFLFAPEPKLSFFPLGPGRGCILAESFYAPTFNRMWGHWLKRDMGAAFNEQMWKFNVSAVFSANGGGAGERTVYKTLCGTQCDLGPPRLPQQPITAAQEKSLIAGLTAMGFFNQTIPPPPPAAVAVVPV